MSQAEFELATHWRITLNFKSLRPHSAAVIAVWPPTWNCELLGFVHVRQVCHTPSLASSVLMAIWFCCGQDFMQFSEWFFRWSLHLSFERAQMCLMHVGWMCLKNTDEPISLEERKCKIIVIRTWKLGWKNGLAVKSAGSSCRRPRLSSQHMSGFSSPSETPVPEHPVPSAGFLGHNTHVVHVHTCRQGIQIKIYAQNKKSALKWVLKWPYFLTFAVYVWWLALMSGLPSSHVFPDSLSGQIPSALGPSCQLYVVLGVCIPARTASTQTCMAPSFLCPWSHLIWPSAQRPLVLPGGHGCLGQAFASSGVCSTLNAREERRLTSRGSRTWSWGTYGLPHSLACAAINVC